MLSYELDRAALDLLRHRGLISRAGRAFFAMPGTGKPPPQGRHRGFGSTDSAYPTAGRLSDWPFRSRARLLDPKNGAAEPNISFGQGRSSTWDRRSDPTERKAHSMRRSWAESDALVVGSSREEFDASRRRRLSRERGPDSPCVPGQPLRVFDRLRVANRDVVEIQKNARVGERCKIQSHTFICEGVTIEDEVFVGHGVMFINDRRPRPSVSSGPAN